MTKDSPKRITNFLQRAAHLLPLILFGVALAIVQQEIKIHPLGQIIGAIKAIPVSLMLTAIGLTIVNYFLLAGYDILALRYTGHKVPLSKVVMTALIGYAISNNTGHSWASGGSIRYRFYTAWGVPGWDVVKISLFLGITYLLGVLTMGLAGTILMPADLRGRIENPQFIVWLMIACAGSLLLYWGLVIFRRKPLVIRGTELGLPSFMLTVCQTAVSCFDLFLAAVVLWLFMPDHPAVDFQTFLVIYVVAQVAGLISQVPGGIGVFEGSFLWLAGGLLPPEHHLALVSALVLYRMVYYFIPLAFAGMGLLGYEGYVRRTALAEGSRVVVTMVSGIMPQILSILLLITGGVLLVSGATPGVPANMKWLHDFVPLSVVELSHLLGSLTGLALLFLARGILLRIDAAWYASILMLGIGAAFSLLKGLDWKEACVMLVMILLLLPSHTYFRRKSSLLTVPFSAGWIVMILIVLAGSAWIGFFAYRYVDYGNELWWKFSYRGDAPRFLRAALTVAVTATAFAAWRLFGVARQKNCQFPSPAELEEAALVAERCDDPNSFLALTGDKKLFWSENRQAFIMFADTSRYWIAMGDPVGNRPDLEQLLWRFREEADRHGAKAVFYEVSEKLMPLYVDLGMTLLKIGEYAKVPLASFSLEGGKRENMRKNRNRFSKNGFTLSILPPAEIARELPRLREISDAWSARKNTREKAFSLGFFNDAYLQRTPVAVIRDSEGKIMAFANLWITNNKEEMSIDLMRYDPDGPTSIMEFLFTELILWAKTEGYRYFGLGMVPLAGLERRPLAPLWHKIGTAIFDLGEEFYNFEGLYAYKAKFDPEWRPRYLAAPAGLQAPVILLHIAGLIAGGWKGVIGR